MSVTSSQPQQSAGARVDLNADMGESFGAYTIGRDEQLLDLVSSANIACGFHAGDPSVMAKTVAAAAARGVRIGAHPGYRDLAGFGRRAMAYEPHVLAAEITYQVGALQAFARQHGVEVAYVKPHGALYNTIAHDRQQATGVLQGLRDFTVTDPDTGAVTPIPLMVLAGSPLAEWAREAGHPVIQEAFADRAYNPDGTLVSRSLPGAVHHDPAVVAQQALALATGQPITASDGSSLVVACDSICVHGDNDEAVAMVSQITKLLTQHGVVVSA